MALKLIIIRWIRTGSQPNLKIMYNIVLQTIFHKHSNKNIRLIPVLLAKAFAPSGLTKLVLILLSFILYSRKAVYNTIG